MSSGFVLVLSGPSGAGKDTVIDELIKQDKDTVISISMTTRKPRPGEVDGKDYYFVSKEEKCWNTPSTATITTELP